MTQKDKKILAVASAGGHWIQLMRLYPAFHHLNLYWISTDNALVTQVPSGSFYSVRDANMWDKIGLIVLAYQIFWKIMIIRPNIVLTTGAAPGFFAVFFGRMFGAKTIWIDSMANVDELSLAGKKVRYFVHHWYTQWPHLSSDNGPKYIGTVL